VQLPLPKHMNEEKVLGAIQLAKDVDGFHPLNIGKLSMKAGTDGECSHTSLSHPGNRTQSHPIKSEPNQSL
jgi:5,10-methylene-tetrahydrofolate dehydrogenase/methenyl tetrahydrofolate cyclohydrolase